MDSFDYSAVDTSGTRLSGSIMATTPREARDLLRAQNLTPIHLHAAKTKKQGGVTFERKARHRDITQATRQLSILIDADTPVEEALKIVALQFERSPMRQILLNVRSQVLEGAKLSAALKSHPKTFSPLYTAMIASGETSGHLASVLGRLATDWESSQKIRRKILAATVYPVVLSVLAIGVVIVLMVFIIPKVVAQFDSFGQDLPGLTKAVIGISAWLRSYGLIALIGVVLCLFGFSRALMYDGFKTRWHRFILTIPLIGKLSRNLNAARFARTISGLIESGTPSLTAMETARHTLRNKIMRDAVTEATLRVREGTAISAALKRTGVFPPLVTQMVSAGESSGDIGAMFSKSADYLEGEFDSTTTVFLNLFEPLIIILLAGIVLLIIGAIFLPILRLNTMAF